MSICVRQTVEQGANQNSIATVEQVLAEIAWSRRTDELV